MALIKRAAEAAKLWAKVFAGLCAVCATAALPRADEITASELGSLLWIGAVLSLCVVLVWSEEKRI